MQTRVSAGVLAGVLLAVAGVRGQAEDRLVYATPGGPAFVVTAEGLSEIRLGGRVVASGGWYAWNAGPGLFGRGENDDPLARMGHTREACRAAAEAVTAKRIEVLGPDRARVTHEMAGGAAVTEFAFAGEDVTISTRVENLDPDRPVLVPAFGGLRFAFAKPPEGQMRCWHTSYLRASLKNCFHPGQQNKIGGSYAVDGAVGVGTTPLRTGLAQTLQFWDYDDWGKQGGPVRWFCDVRLAPIPPGGALTFHTRLRVSASQDWKHLLAPYKEHFLATFGEPRYERDYRLAAVMHANRNLEAIGPANPYGFHGGGRRLDTDEGVAALQDMLLEPLRAANGKGVILWGQTGQEPRGGMYRADFDVIPPEVEARWPAWAKRFREAGLEVGVTTRPRHLHVRKDWTRDMTIDINPDDPRHLEMLWARFKRMIDLGCTMFYLDSFGGSFDDVKTMRHLREKMGPGIATYAEHQNDAMAAYSAFYCETDFWAAGTKKGLDEPAYLPRAGLTFMEVVNWMLGPVPTITRLYDKHGEIPEGFESSNTFFYRHRMTPMIADYRLKDLAAELRALQDRFLPGDGRTWR